VTTVWSAEQLERISRSAELQIASGRGEGTLLPPVQIWVVCVDGAVYVRTWYRRTSGWFGKVIKVPEARIRVPGLQADVTIIDLGECPPGLRSRVDAAYCAKYSVGYESMVSDEAAATTLRLDPR